VSQAGEVPAGDAAGGAPASAPRTTWDPGQYLRYADHRLRPALDLIERIPSPSPRTIYDLGCGTGNVTRLLAARWPAATVTGMDHSREMLAQAAGEPAPAPGPAPRAIRWVEADLRDWRPENQADLLFSNATLHWLPDHQALFPLLVSWLAPGGCLAVQMPRSWGLPSHRLMRETLAERDLGSAELRRSLERVPVEEPSAYYELLAPRTAHLDIWETEYLQALEGPDPVLEWVKATGLRPVLLTLSEAEKKEFLRAYAARLRYAYPPSADGRTLYPFRRLFLVARV
jgi:trans-aconitate 2-methyltransferase